MLCPIIISAAFLAAEPRSSGSNDWAMFSISELQNYCPVLSLDPASFSKLRLSTAQQDKAMAPGTPDLFRRFFDSENGNTTPPQLVKPGLPSTNLTLGSIANDDPFAQIGDVIDVTSFDMPDFQADIVALFASTGVFQPFIAVAHQYVDVDDVGRFGIGAGTEWHLGVNATLGTQLLFLSHDRQIPDSELSRNDVCVMTRLEISF